MPETDLSDPDLPRLMRRLGLPAMAGLSLNAAHQLTDAAFVGRLGGEALAALSLLAPLAGLVAAAGIGLGIGAASCLARELGAGRPEAARRVAGTALGAAAGLGLLAAVLLAVFRARILYTLGTPAALFDQASALLAVQSLTTCLAILQIACDFLAIGRGDARFSLKTLALCFGLNIALDPVMIFGLGLGLPGAAWATLAAQLVTLAAWAGHFAAPARRPLRGSLRHLRRIVAIGLPEAASVTATTLGLLALFAIAAHLGGEQALAGLGIATRLVFAVALPLEGFAIGVLPVLAHAHGAADPARAARTLRLLAGPALRVTVTLALMLALAAGPAARLLTADPAIAGTAAAALRWLAPALPATALRLAAQVWLQAAIRPRMAALLGLAPMGWLLWPALAVTVPVHGAAGLPMAMAIAAFGAAVLAAAVLCRAAFPNRSAGVPA